MVEETDLIYTTAENIRAYIKTNSWAPKENKQKRFI